MNFLKMREICTSTNSSCKTRKKYDVYTILAQNFVPETVTLRILVGNFMSKNNVIANPLQDQEFYCKILLVHSFF